MEREWGIASPPSNCLVCILRMFRRGRVPDVRFCHVDLEDWVIATPPPVRYKKTVGLWRGDRRPKVAEMAMLISERKHHFADSRWSSRLAFSSVLIFICYLSVPARVFPSDPTHPTRTQPKLRQARLNIFNCTHIEHVNPVHGRQCIVIRAQ